jgi:D-3-phosphoglycerate dehydrogenase
MDRAPKLRLISRVGIGLDGVDLLAARERGIAVSYTPDAPAPAVAELTTGLMLALLRGISSTDRNMRNGVWHRVMGRRLARCTVGIIGVGRIGKRLIRHLGGFGCRILANDLEPDWEFGRAHGVEWGDKERIFREADIITLHVPLTPLTRNLITRRELDWMKPTALLVNTARGPLVSEHDLADALRNNGIAGAAIDVFSLEPYAGELCAIERCILTCHMGSMSVDCRTQMEVEATEEAVRFLRNEPLLHRVPEVEFELCLAAGGTVSGQFA